MNIALIFCKIDDLFSNYPAGVFSMFESNPPLGLGAIGTVAKLRGHKVKVFDQLLHKYDNEKLIEKICEFKPDVLGFSCTSLNIENTYFCAKNIKEAIDCMLFAGGIHVTLCTEKVLDKGIFDFLISGEGEEVFEEVLKKLEKHSEIKNLNIPGLWINGKLSNGGMAILSTIDQPIIDRHLLEINLYKNKGALLEETPCYSIFSSRGCPYTCKFCSKPDYFKIYRQRQVDSVVNEIHLLINEFGAKTISFREDNFTVDLNRLELFCSRMIEEFDGKLFWECESRADLPKQILELMYRAGCRGIWCGIETIVPKWSKWIDKGLEKEQVVKFYDNCHQIGIKTGALFMFGFPEQTKDEIEKDIEFAISLPTVFSAFQCLAIFPGSPLEPYYKDHPELSYYVTEGISLALTGGYDYKEMIRMEQEINERIKSVRITSKR